MNHMHMRTWVVLSIPVALTNSTEWYFKHKGLCQVQKWPLWCKSIWITPTLPTIKLLLHYIHTTPPHTAPTTCYIALLLLPRLFNLKALYVYLKLQRLVYGSTAYFHTTPSTVLFWWQRKLEWSNTDLFYFVYVFVRMWFPHGRIVNTRCLLLHDCQKVHTVINKKSDSRWRMIAFRTCICAPFKSCTECDIKQLQLYLRMVSSHRTINLAEGKFHDQVQTDGHTDTEKPAEFTRVLSVKVYTAIVPMLQ